jgi:hypothetical protein
MPEARAAKMENGKSIQNLGNGRSCGRDDLLRAVPRFIHLPTPALISGFVVIYVCAQLYRPPTLAAHVIFVSDHSRVFPHMQHFIAAAMRMESIDGHQESRRHV